MTHQNRTPSPEQIEIARWTASLGAITAEALAHRLGVSLSSARARLSAAQRRGLLSSERPLAGRPSLYTLTRAGLRVASVRGIDLSRVSASGAHHLIVCASVAASLERCYPDHRVIGERELRRDEREQGRSLASAPMRVVEGCGSRLHRPDLVLWPIEPHGAPPVAVEVELTVKSPRRLLDICRAWSRCQVLAGVLYLVPPEVEPALLRAIAQARAAERVVVVPLSCLPGLEPIIQTTSEGRSQRTVPSDA